VIHLEVRRAADGRIQARRDDGLPLTPEDREAARKLIEQQAPLVTAQAVLANHTPDDIEKIMAVWRRLFGFSESRERIAAQVRELHQWQTKRGAKAIGKS